jgi:hypothetical protein
VSNRLFPSYCYRIVCRCCRRSRATILPGETQATTGEPRGYLLRILPTPPDPTSKACAAAALGREPFHPPRADSAASRLHECYSTSPHDIPLAHRRPCDSLWFSVIAPAVCARRLREGDALYLFDQMVQCLSPPFLILLFWKTLIQVTSS